MGRSETDRGELEAARRAAGASLPEPARVPRPFDSICSDLMLVAGAGIVSPQVRVKTERAVRALAQEAFASGAAASLTPAAVADWLRQPASRGAVAGWLRERTVELLRERAAEAAPADLQALERTIELLRRPA